ncbi:MAG TPA: hypothetical protein VFC19_18875 [Candidatus Limnocylindrales bacterium]|nr:hypothetical protein [Candidatus Limnocylindrales bacterium]
MKFMYALAVLAVLPNPGHVAHAYAADCLGSGTEAVINAALSGPGATAVLCPGAVFELHGSVRFTAANQRLTTLGQPTDASRANLRIVAATLTAAVYGLDQSGVVVENVQVDGNRSALGYLAGPALIQLGGAATGQVVRQVAARHTRSWSTIHIHEGGISANTPLCQRATISDNQLGPAGMPDGTWADGISLACGNSLVARNTIRDATDGAIVVFGAPGSLIQDNTIVAETRQLLGGINLVDFGPTNGNYTGTRVTGNVIDARSEFIKVAVAMGPRVWSCAGGVGANFGASVTGNRLSGQNMGYGFAVAGVSGWTVSGNVDQSRHVGRPGSGCDGVTATPAGYQVQSAQGSSLQPGFVTANVVDVLRVTEPAILRLPPRPPTACGRIAAGEWLGSDQALLSCDGRFRLILQLDGNLVLYQGNTPLWATGIRPLRVVMAIMQNDGNFVAYDTAGNAVFASRTAVPGSRLLVQNDGNMVVYDPSGRPLWATNTCCH